MNFLSESGSKRRWQCGFGSLALPIAPILMQCSIRRKGYAISVKRLENRGDAARTGLCAACRFMRRMNSDRGTTFYLCERSLTDPAFPKYPRLPVLQCAGYERRSTHQNPRD